MKYEVSKSSFKARASCCFYRRNGPVSTPFLLEGNGLVSHWKSHPVCWGRRWGILNVAFCRRLSETFLCLFRENEVLKVQLKKYVGAVQMLKREGSQGNDGKTLSTPPSSTSPRPEIRRSLPENLTKRTNEISPHQFITFLRIFNNRFVKLHCQKWIFTLKLNIYRSKTFG